MRSFPFKRIPAGGFVKTKGSLLPNDPSFDRYNPTGITP